MNRLIIVVIVLFACFFTYGMFFMVSGAEYCKALGYNTGIKHYDIKSGEDYYRCTDIVTPDQPE